MNSFARTGALTRLALRLDRVRLPLWVLVIGVSPAATAKNYQKIYPTADSLKVVSGVLANPSLVALNGPLFRVSIGSLTGWKIGATAFVLAALMSIFTVVRHTRAEEETGRAELVGATVVGRRAPLTAALVTAALANAGIAVVTALGLMGTKLPTAGSFAFGLSIGLVGMVFAAVAAVAAQCTGSARTANGISGAVLGAAYLIRAVGDPGPTWLSWVSPIGWAMRLRPYASEQWWVALPLAGFVAVAVVVSYSLAARRDLGAGLVAERPAAPVASPSLGSPLGLAWRLQRGTLLGWVIAMAVAGAVMGGAAHSIGDVSGLSQQMLDLLARMGGRKALVDEFLATVFGLGGLTAAAYTVQATMRLRGEEANGRVESLLATGVSRIRWAASHLLFAAFGTAVLLAAFGAFAGLSYGASIHDYGQVGRLTVASLVQLPAAWVLAGIGVALFGLSARLAIVTWAAFVACVLVVEIGAIVGLSHWLVDLSPFAHVPKLPGAAFTGTPVVLLVVVSVVLVAAGLAGFRRRDIS
jgi:ABC-2 type transport system permease protein